MIPVWRNPVHLLAFGLGAGLAPRAPGTAGTVVGVAAWLGLSMLPLPLYVAATGAAFGLGIWICGATARDLGVPDHGGIVWDEIVGFLVTMIALPRAWQWALAGFVLFRILDVLKPWPIGWLDRRVHGGLGIMVDDLAAGAIAAVALNLAAIGLSP